jgi:hypothetical protein
LALTLHRADSSLTNSKKEEGPMKNVLISLILTLSASMSLAQVVAQDTGTLPEIQVLGVEVDRGPELAAVQPTADLKFQFASCATQELQANVEERDGKLFVSVILPRTNIDCMGSTRLRDYSLQISSDYRNEPVVVLNPVRTFLRR